MITVCRMQWIFTAACIFHFAVVISTYGQQPRDRSVSLQTLDRLVQQWMTLRTTLSEEQRAWEEREAQWKDEIKLLAQEAETLGREIAKGSGRATSVEAERAELLARKEALEDVLERLRPALDRAEAELRAWRVWIPESLRDGMTAAFRGLPKSQEQADQQALSKRARNAAALYTQIESLQNALHVTRQMLDTGAGARRQVDVLYIGLARGFAVTPDSDWAAIGVPDEAGWAWTPAPSNAGMIRKAIAVVNRQQTAQLVELPLQVAGEVTP
jgi:hypothetical protein